MNRLRVIPFTALLVAACAGEGPGPIQPGWRGLDPAATDCDFTVSGTTMTLQADCTTDETLFIPDGFTLDGANHTIHAVDPPGGNFYGAVVRNAGATAHVTRLGITADVADVCATDILGRFIGILFFQASGSITHSTLLDVHKPESFCLLEGSAILVRNFPVPGVPPAPRQTVEIAHNRIDRYGRQAIILLGNARGWIHHNDVGAGANQETIATSSIAIVFGGASADIAHNRIEGNQWLGAPSDSIGAAIWLDRVTGVTVRHNVIRGNSDVGVALVGGGVDVTIEQNEIFDVGADAPDGSTLDVGIGDFVGVAAIGRNVIRGFDQPTVP